HRLEEAQDFCLVGDVRSDGYSVVSYFTDDRVRSFFVPDEVHADRVALLHRKPAGGGADAARAAGHQHDPAQAVLFTTQLRSVPIRLRVLCAKRTWRASFGLDSSAVHDLAMDVDSLINPPLELLGRAVYSACGS